MTDEPPPDAPSRFWEWVHFSRAVMWIPLTAGVFAMGWYEDPKKMLGVTLIYSAYANFTGDLGVWQGRRAERRSLENP